MTTFARSTPEAEVAATIDDVRRTRVRRDELLALLPDNVSLYQGRTSAEVTRLRGYLLAAFADTGLPPTALPYALEALESGHAPYEVAGAAIAVRAVEGPAAQVVPYLMRAVHNLSGADATVSFEQYDPRWPYAEPTTALTEVLRTIAGLGAQAASALAELEHLATRRDHPAPVLAEMHSAIEAIRSAPEGCGAARGPEHAAAHHCCADAAPVQRFEHHAAGASSDTLDVALQDQDGRAESFATFFCGKPSVVAFFYTRCDNPYKCSLTVRKLASLQAMIRERGLSRALRLAAITYDPEFDTPKRLELYGSDRGLAFGDDTRFFRSISGFAELSRRFGLNVNYGPSTVNRHQIETYLLDVSGEVAASFTRFQWEPDELLTTVESLFVSRPTVAPA